MKLSVAVTGFKRYPFLGPRPITMPKYTVVHGETKQEAMDKAREIESQSGITPEHKLGLENQVRQINNELNQQNGFAGKCSPQLTGYIAIMQSGPSTRGSIRVSQTIRASSKK